MDVRFPVWLSLHLRNDVDIRKRVNQIQKLFMDDRITNDLFTADGVDLLRRVRAWLYDTKGKLRTDLTRKPTTIAHDIEAVGYYAKFRGHAYPLLTDSKDGLVAKAGVHARHVQQATFSMGIQDASRALTTVSQVVNTLRTRQTLINARIHRWLVLGNLDTTVQNKQPQNSTQSLITFGVRELRPFLELALRYTYLPLSMARVTHMGITTTQALPEDAEFWTGKAVQKAMPLADYLILRDGQFMHVSMAFPNGRATGKDRSQGRIVVRPVGQALSVYIYFYDTYCKGGNRSLHKRGYRTPKNCPLRPLFTGISGGQVWKDVRSDTETYADRLEMPTETMGLRDRNYHFISVAQWVACRAHLHQINPSAVAGDVTVMKAGFQNEGKFYPGLRGLRDREDALEGILGIGRPDPVPNNVFTLLNVPENLDTLQSEMDNMLLVIEGVPVHQGAQNLEQNTDEMEAWRTDTRNILPPLEFP